LPAAYSLITLLHPRQTGGQQPVANNLQMFERLGYGSLAVGLLSDLIGRRGDMTETIVIVVITLVAAALVWAAARKAQRWAAAILGVIAILTLGALIGTFWAGAPAWMQPETPPAILVKILDVVAAAMLFAALYFYYFAGDEQTA
jgi:MFS family permease